MVVAPHPSPETLVAFVKGDLPAAELASVAEHIGNCAACSSLLRSVPNDPLSGLARIVTSAKTPDLGPTLPAPVCSGKADPIPHSLVDHHRYRVLSELGAGGMGVVYMAEHRIMRRIVALKVMAPHLIAKTGAVERFRKEVHAAASLNHPNIVTAYDADEAGGLHFLVMEFVEGVSLDRLVAKKGPLPVPMACQFARQVALGLQHAAEKGMVHRDIKPQNVMVTKKAQVKVMDFGLARFARTDIEEDRPATGRVPFGAGKSIADPLTNPNVLMGTPDYLSPEQAKNSHAVDARSDIYSLGCTLHFLLTGKPPFSHASTLIDKLLAHTEESPPAIRELRPDVPESLAAVLAKMMAKKADDRYSLAAEAAAALLPFARAGNGSPSDRAALEVIDAVVVAPPATTVATPIALVVEAFALDVASVPDGSTLAESADPAQSKQSKKAKKPAAKIAWWKWKAAKVAAAAILLTVVTLAVAGGRKKPEIATTPADDSQTAANTNPGVKPLAKTNPTRPSVPAKEVKEIKILYVLPSEGLWPADYQPVRDRLERSPGVKIVTASGTGKSDQLFQHDDNKGRPVAVDVQLRPDMDLTDYAAVVFCGVRTDEYIAVVGPTGSSAAFAANRVIDKMLKGGKVVAAMCNGERILAMHFALKGKRASYSEAVVPKFLFLLKDDFRGPITWERTPVVVDGKVVTASNHKDAEPFADALLKVLQGE